MNSKWLTRSIAAFVVGALSSASFTQATPVELVGVDGTGKAVDSGWSWETPDPSVVNLLFIRTDGSNFFFQKDADVKTVGQPVVITFQKTSSSASTLVINDEAVTNHSGTDWTAFRMELSSGSSGGMPNFAFTSSSGTGSDIGGFKIDPFTKFTFYNSNSGLLLNGGTVANGTTWFPGHNSNTGLALVANNLTSSTFSLKEIPISVAIPLPAAAWSGLSMLIGLGVIRTVRRARHIG
jgi:hypothetical protein